MEYNPITIDIDVKESGGYKPKSGSKYSILLGEEYLSVLGDYKAVVNVGDDKPDYVNRQVYFNFNFLRGSIGSIDIAVIEIDPETQANTYSLRINGDDCFIFEEDQKQLFLETMDKIMKWNVVS